MVFTVYLFTFRIFSWVPLSLLKRAYHHPETECNFFFSGIFRHQNWWESCWNIFFLYAPTRTFDEKKTRNSNSQKKNSRSSAYFFGSCPKLGKDNSLQHQSTLEEDFSAVRRSWGLRFGHRTDPERYFSKIWKSDVDFHYFGLFRYAFSIWSFSPMRKSWASYLHW